MRAAGFTGAVMSIATNPFRPLARRREVVRGNVARLRRLLEAAGASVVTDAAGYRRARADGRLACFLALQGGNALTADDVAAPELADVSRITLVHLTRSRLGATSAPGGGGRRGLTAEGRHLVEAMAAHDVIVDLAHAGRATFWDALDVHPKATAGDRLPHRCRGPVPFVAQPRRRPDPGRRRPRRRGRDHVPPRLPGPAGSPGHRRRRGPASRPRRRRRRRGLRRHRQRLRRDDRATRRTWPASAGCRSWCGRCSTGVCRRRWCARCSAPTTCGWSRRCGSEPV